jgi:hypothetical protein
MPLDTAKSRCHLVTRTCRELTRLLNQIHNRRTKPLRINTYKSVTKQTTLTPFRINTYEKHRGPSQKLCKKFGLITPRITGSRTEVAGRQR